MSDGDAPKALDTDRLCELTRASADASSHAFAQFSGLPLRVSETSAISAEAPLEPGRWPKGIFFDIEGKLEGQIGILLSPTLCEAVEGGASGRGLTDALDSMLLELGNIVASQTVSAIADGVRGRIVLSIPHLVTEGADQELAWRIAHGSHAAATAGLQRIDAAFTDESGSHCALVILVPQPVLDASSRSV